MRFNELTHLLEKKLDKSKKIPTVSEMIKDLRNNKNLKGSQRFYIECMFDPSIKRSSELKMSDIQWIKDLWFSMYDN